MANKKESVLLPLAKSRVKTRAAAKGLETADLERVITNLKAVLDAEKKKEAQKAESQKRARIAKIKALMDESGLEPEDLQPAGRGRRGRKPGGGKKKTKSKAGVKRTVPPKYRLMVDGEEHLWSGRGRPPRVFKDYMDAGNSKDSCAI